MIVNDTTIVILVLVLCVAGGLAHLVMRGYGPLLIDGLMLAFLLWRPSLAAASLLGVQAMARRVPAVARGLADFLPASTPALVWEIVLPGAGPPPATPERPATGATIMMAPLTKAVAAPPTSVLPPRPPLLPAAIWFPIVQEHPDSVPHTFVLGPSGAGKSWVIEALARERRDQMLVIQPNCQRDDWQGVTVVQCADDGSMLPIARAIEEIRREFARRGGAMKVGDPGPWLTIVWDEIPLCNGKLGDLAKQTVVDIVSAGRPRKIRLLGGSTSERVAALGIEGYGDLILSCAIIRVGLFAVKALPALAEVARPATLEVGGKIHAIDRSAIPQLVRVQLPASRVWNLSAVCLGTGAPLTSPNPGPSVSDRQTDSAAAKQGRIERLAGMRAMKYSRKLAGAKIRTEGGTLDNNEWTEAGKLLRSRGFTVADDDDPPLSLPTPAA